MEMRASEDVDIGQDLTPPLPPLAFSLYNSFLLSHCSSCSSPLPPSPPKHHPHLPSLLNCSPKCSSASSNPHLSAAEHHLLRSSHLSDTSDLRAALRLLFRFRKDIFRSGGFPARIYGLLSNRERLVGIGENNGVLERIRDGGKAIAAARRMSEGLDLDEGGDCVVEEAVLCAVLTNAVEVQVKDGGNVGIAVYDTDFSWINHSCSPNACYRFLPPEFSGSESQLRIAPAATAGSGGIEFADSGACNKCESINEFEGYGPRVVVRSIKAIKKGEEVSIAYTDLLQPKALRQSELWLKYQFICCCRRCRALPPSYVDIALQGVSVVDLDCINQSSNQNFYGEKEIEKLADHIEDAISDYLSLNNAKSCCEKLENALTHGLPNPNNHSQQNIRLHPLHHLSLTTYTTLASAYKVRGTELLDLNPKSNNDEKNYTHAFNMIRISSAYSFLLAGATHHLLLSESSLIASAANFWTYAGESLIGLARSTFWNDVLKQRSPVTDFSLFQSHISCDCALMEKFEADFVSNQSQNAEFGGVSRDFLHCVTNISPDVWNFLVSGNCYLRTIKDPLDFSWLGSKKSTNVSDFEEERFGDGEKERMNIFGVGFHCLLYGGFLSRICWGKDSYLNIPIQSVLNGDRT